MTFRTLLIAATMAAAFSTATADPAAVSASASWASPSLRTETVTGPNGAVTTPVARDANARLGVTESKVTNDPSAARRRFRVIVLETLREVTASEEEFRAEARAVLGVDP